MEFFYDLLDLCGKFDPNMAEPVKLQNLWRGLKPSLVEKFWSMKPAKTDEFLTEVKRYREMTLKTRHEEWAMGMLGNQMPHVENGRLNRLEKMLERLMGRSVREERESQRVVEWRKMAGLEELKRQVKVMEVAVWGEPVD